MGFCSCTVKFLLVIFNLACAIAGLAILIVGILSNTKGSSFKALLSGEVTTASIGLMVLGAIVFLIAFFGCCGALREDTCMIQTYGVILLAILIAEIAVGITAFVYKGKVIDKIDEMGEQFFHNYHQNNVSINDIQKDLQCCGYNGKDDFSSTDFPTSCCPKDVKVCTKREAYSKGCKNAIKNDVKHILGVIGGVAIGIAVIELLGVICAFYVSSSIRKERRRGYA